MKTIVSAMSFLLEMRRTNNILSRIDEEQIATKFSQLNQTNKMILISEIFGRQKIELPPLRVRMPKSGHDKNIAECIEEILREEARPLSVKELFDALIAKGRKVDNLKDFSSQLINIAKSKKQFHKEKIVNKNYWGLSEWMNGTGKGFNLFLAKIKQ